MRQNLAGTPLTELCQRLIQQASDDPSDANALLDASIILQFYGDEALALRLQRMALSKKAGGERSPPANLVRLR